MGSVSVSLARRDYSGIARHIFGKSSIVGYWPFTERTGLIARETVFGPRGGLDGVYPDNLPRVRSANSSFTTPWWTSGFPVGSAPVAPVAIDLLTAAFQDRFNVREGSFSIALFLSTDAWSASAAIRQIGYIRGSSANYHSWRKPNTIHSLDYTRKATGATDEIHVAWSPVIPRSWMIFAYTWSETAQEMTWQTSRQTATIVREAMSSTWDSTKLTLTDALIGGSVGGGSPWDGGLAHCLFLNRAANPTDMVRWLTAFGSNRGQWGTRSP